MTENSQKITLRPGEGAIVFSDEGIKMFAASDFSGLPLEVRDTMDFVTYALMRTEWIIEFYEHLATADAIIDLMGEKHYEPPKLTLIKGGLYGTEDEKKDES